MAPKGLRVHAIDVVKNHVQWTLQEIQAQGFEKAIDVRLMDYHHLDGFDDESYEGVYTMETLVHATNAEKVLGEFFRVLKPGGSVALHEYNHVDFDTAPRDAKNLIECLQQINKRASMPSHDAFSFGVLERRWDIFAIRLQLAWDLRLIR